MLGTSSGQMGRMALSRLAAWFVFKQEQNVKIMIICSPILKTFNILIIIPSTDLISSISVLGNIPNFKSLVSTFCENKILRILEIPRNLKYLKHCSNNDLVD